MSAIKQVINTLRKIARKNPALKRAVYKYKFRYHQPSWGKLLQKDHELWNAALSNGRVRKKILIATSVGSHLTGTRLESVLAIALTLRDAEVHILLCDKALPACSGCWYELFPNFSRFAKFGPQRDLCGDCFLSAYRMYNSLGLKVHTYSEYLTAHDLSLADKIASTIRHEDIKDYTFEKMAVGEHALAGALRFYARGDLDNTPQAKEILRRFFKAALLTVFATQKLLKSHAYDCAVFHHGIYVPQGLIGEVCRAMRVRVVNWNPGYKKHTFIFSHHNTYHRTMINEPVGNWNNAAWNDNKEKKLNKYLQSRWRGTEDWIWFHEKPEFKLQGITKQFKIDFTKPCIGLLTSVLWDAVLHYSSNAFPNMLAWVKSSIDYFAQRTDLQLIIRIHPGEIHGGLPAQQRMENEIRRAYPVLPENIKIIPPESNASTYMLMAQCDAVIIYNTKSGIELAAMGIPVIVAGEAWTRNKGFTIDVSDSQHYVSILEKLPLQKKMSEQDILKAKKYAYHFFFSRFIPLAFMKASPYSSVYKIDIESIRDLTPTQSTGLDVICDGIIKGSEFVYPANDQ